MGWFSSYASAASKFVNSSTATRRAAIGAGIGAGWGMFSNDTSMIGGAAMGAGLGYGSAYLPQARGLLSGMMGSSVGRQMASESKRVVPRVIRRGSEAAQRARLIPQAVARSAGPRKIKYLGNADQRMATWINKDMQRGTGVGLGGWDRKVGGVGLGPWSNSISAWLR